MTARRMRGEPRIIPFAEIEAGFTLRPLGEHPPVRRLLNGDYIISVLVGREANVDVFVCGPDGTVLGAPRGYARLYRPGRVVGLDEAVATYARRS